MEFKYPPESRPLDGYTLKRGIAAGGFGEVYYGLSDSGKQVAIKLLKKNKDVELRGVQYCLNLRHKNLVAIHDIRQDTSADLWVIMEYIPGDTLEHALRKPGVPLPNDIVQCWLKGVTAALAHLHDMGVAHRDVKPANVFWDNGEIKLGDVGLAKLMAQGSYFDHTDSIGTVYYMAPEISKGNYNFGVDIYSCGVMLYQMLSGTLPFDGESQQEIMLKHLFDLPNMSVIPPAFQSVVSRALEKDPKLRIQTITQFYDEFERGLIAASVTHRNVVPHPVQKLQPQSLGIPNGIASSMAQGIGGNDDSRSSSELKQTTLFEAKPVQSVQHVSAGTDQQIPIPNSSNKQGAFDATVIVSKQPSQPSLTTVVGSNSPIAKRRSDVHQRLENLTVSMGWAILFTLLFAVGAGSLSPLFRISGTFNPDPAKLGLFALTILLGSWLVLVVAKLTEGGSCRYGARRGLCLVVGIGVGIAAWWLSQVLMVEIASDQLKHKALFDTFGMRPLAIQGKPTLMGFIVFFGSLFLLRQWTLQADSSRSEAFQIIPVILSVAVAAMLPITFAFPWDWAVTWAAVMSCVVQLSAVWTPLQNRSLAA